MLLLIYIIKLIIFSKFIEEILSIGNDNNYVISKTYWASSLLHQTVPTNPNDGILKFDEECTVTYSKNSYVVFDLIDVMQIRSVKIYNTHWDKTNSLLFEIAMADNFKWCNIENLYYYRTCEAEVVEGIEPSETHLEMRGECEGKFIIIRLKKYDVQTYLKICEFEIAANLANRSPVEVPLNDELCNAISSIMNIMLNKPVLLSNHWHTEFINDGILDSEHVWQSCYASDINNSQMVVINLIQRYNINSLRIWNSIDRYEYGTSYKVTVSIGDTFKLQTKDKDLQSFSTVKGSIRVLGPSIEIYFMEPVKAQFLKIEAVDNYNDYFILCEVEARGSVLNEKPYEEPVIESDMSLKADTTVFDQMWTPDLSFNFPPEVVKLIHSDSNCEEILQVPNVIPLIAVACTYGKGRVMVFGKEDIFLKSIHLEENAKLKSAIFQWLSPNGVDAMVMNQLYVNDPPPGTIVYFHPQLPIDKKIERKLLEDLKAGKFSLVLEMPNHSDIQTMWRQIMFLLTALQLDFDYEVPEYPSGVYPLTKLTNANAYPGITRLIRSMGINYNDFVFNFDKFTSSFDNFKPYMLNKKSMGTEFRLAAEHYSPAAEFSCPIKESPLSKEKEEFIFSLNRFIIYKYMAYSGFKAPCVNTYPGDYPDNEIINRITVTLRIMDLVVEKEFHSSGYFLAAGDTLKYTTLSILGNWEIAIGCQLIDFRKDRRYKNIYRFPKVSVDNVTVDEYSGEVFTPFGGIIWFKSYQINTHLMIRLDNVVQTLFLNLQDTITSEMWDTQRQTAKGLFGEMQTSYISFCLESSFIRPYSFDYLKDILVNDWDQIIYLNYQLIGELAKSNKRFRVVTDIESSIYNGEPEYPLTLTHSYVNEFLNKTFIRIDGSWRFLRRLSFGFIPTSLIFEGSQDALANLFALFNYNFHWKWDILNDRSRIFTPHTRLMATYMLDRNPNIESWKSDSYFGTMIFAHFVINFDWGIIRNVFQKHKNTNFQTNQEKIDAWMETISDQVGQNVQPIFDFWGLPISEAASARQATKTCFFPDDEIVNLSRIRKEFIIDKYGKKCETTASQKYELTIATFETRENNVFIENPF